MIKQIPKPEEQEIGITAGDEVSIWFMPGMKGLVMRVVDDCLVLLIGTRLVLTVYTRDCDVLIKG